MIIPALNEEVGIAKTIEEIPLGKFEQAGLEAEIVVVDGGSKDKTKEVAMGKGAKVIIEGRRGYGRAYKTGFEAATGEIIATGDADGTYPFSMVPELIEIMDREDLDFITTNRFGSMEEGAMSPLHRLGNGILNLATRLLHGVKIKDSQSGMWVFRKNILGGMELVSDGMSFSEEIKIEAFKKFRAKEVPIVYGKRGEEPKKIRSWRDGFDNLLFLLKRALIQ